MPYTPTTWVPQTTPALTHTQLNRIETGTDTAVAHAEDAGVHGGAPTGSVFLWPISTPPTDFLVCDGSVVSRTTYATLFAIISTVWNTGGEAGTDFRLPNFQDRVPIGKSGTKALASLGGAATYTLTTTQMPAHTHGIAAHTHATDHNHGATGADSASHTHTGTSGTNSATHTHGAGLGIRWRQSNYWDSSGLIFLDQGAGSEDADAASGTTDAETATHTHTTTTGTESATHTHTMPTYTGTSGGASADMAAGAAASSFSLLNPYAALVYIIRT